MRSFFVFFLTTIFLTGGARAFDGCYKTLEINGSTVLSGPDQGRSQSMIYSVQNEFYYDLQTRSSLKTKVISLFTSFNGGWYSFSNPLVFEELGRLEVSANRLTYSFDGEVFHRNSSYALERVDFKTEVDLQKYAGIVTGYIKQSSRALDRNTDMAIILKEVECAE